MLQITRSCAYFYFLHFLFTYRFDHSVFLCQEVCRCIVPWLKPCKFEFHLSGDGMKKYAFLAVWCEFVPILSRINLSRPGPTWLFQSLAKMPKSSWTETFEGCCLWQSFIWRIRIIIIEGNCCWWKIFWHFVLLVVMSNTFKFYQIRHKRQQVTSFSIQYCTSFVEWKWCLEVKNITLK